MGTLLDLASLVVVPSGYKEDIIYSVKPTDGTGDLDFTRSLDTATRVGSDGLIEKVRTNLFLQSQTFDNAYWSTGNTTVTANATTAPDGTLTAEKLAATTTGTDRRIQRAESISAGIYTNSIFVKASELNIVRMYAVDFSSQATFTLTGSGTISSVIGSATANIESVGNGWYRCSMSVSFAGGSTQTLYFNIGNAFGGATINAGDGVFIWGAQLETGDIATPYIPTTTAAVSVGMLANVPRLDYLGGGCPKLLLEPQRVNELLFSEQLNNAAWTKGAGVNITKNTNVSPDGFTNADRANTTASTDVSVFQAGSTSGTTFTASVFAKKGTNKFVLLTINGTNNFNSRFQGVFNLDTATLASTNNSTTPLTGTSAKIENYGNGWYRLSVTATFAVSAQSFVGIQNTNVTPSLGGDNLEINNATTGNAFYYGCQVEAGSYATSYIPTLGAAVTRSADAASKTGISALIGQTEGVWYYEGVINNTNLEFQILNSTRNTTNSISITRDTSNRVRAMIFVGGLVVNIHSANNVFVNTKSKIALSYKSGNIKLFYNGVLVGSSTNAFAFTVPISELEISVMVNFFGNSLNTNNAEQVLIFPTQLTDAQCLELTA